MIDYSKFISREFIKINEFLTFRATIPINIDFHGHQFDKQIIKKYFDDLSEYHCIYMINHFDLESFMCSKCGCYDSGDNYYQCKNSKICMKCYNNEENAIHYYVNPDPEGDSFKCTTFGSILDWIPLIRDQGDGGEYYIHINCNRDSPHFKRIAMQAEDNHSRLGYFITDLTLEQIKEQIEENKVKGESSIEVVMEKNDMPIYYG